jgi:hypothetical protein
MSVLPNIPNLENVHADLRPYYEQEVDGTWKIDLAPELRKALRSEREIATELRRKMKVQQRIITDLREKVEKLRNRISTQHDADMTSADSERLLPKWCYPSEQTR